MTAFLNLFRGRRTTCAPRGKFDRGFEGHHGLHNGQYAGSQWSFGWAHTAMEDLGAKGACHSSVRVWNRVRVRQAYLPCTPPAQSQKEGPHKTVFLVSGAEYRGEWSGNQRHGARLRERQRACMRRDAGAQGGRNLPCRPTPAEDLPVQHCDAMHANIWLFRQGHADI